MAKRTDEPLNAKSEVAVAKFLMELIEDNMYDDRCDIRSIDTFRDAGVLTNNEGLVISVSGGRQYQITVVRSR